MGIWPIYIHNDLDDENYFNEFYLMPYLGLNNPLNVDRIDSTIVHKTCLYCNISILYQYIM